MTKKDSSLYLVIIVVIAALLGYFTIYKNIIGEYSLNASEAFMLMLAALAIGEVVSIRTKAAIPSIFITAGIFIIGFWTIFPKDILQISGIGKSMPGLFVMIMVTHLGTMLDKDELVAQWKTVVVTLAGMAGVCLMVMTVGRLLVGTEVAATATPPLTGGLVSAIIMQGAVEGNEYLVVIAMAMYVLQGFVGFPLINLCLKIEGKNVLTRFRAGEISLEDINGGKNNKKETKSGIRIFPETSGQYKTDYIILLKTLVLVVISGYLQNLTKWGCFQICICTIGRGSCCRNWIHRKKTFGNIQKLWFVYNHNHDVRICRIKQCNNRSFKINNNQLHHINRTGYYRLLALLSIPIGKKIGLSKSMAFAIGLGSIAGGFPASYVLSNEAAKLLSDNDNEYELLLEHFLPKTLVSGFVSATSGSVIIAGLFVSLFF